MNPVRIENLLNLIERAKIPPPNTDQDATEYDAIVARNLAIIAKAEAEIQDELLV